MPNQECAKLRAASIECSYSNRRQREHILGASDYHRIVGIRKRDADYPHLLIPHLTVCLLRPTQSLNGGRPGRLPSGSGYPDRGAMTATRWSASISPKSTMPLCRPGYRPAHQAVIPLKAKIENVA